MCGQGKARETVAWVSVGVDDNREFSNDYRFCYGIPVLGLPALVIHLLFFEPCICMVDAITCQRGNDVS